LVWSQHYFLRYFVGLKIGKMSQVDKMYKPKRPLNGYMRYCADFRTSEDAKSYSASDSATEAGRRWKREPAKVDDPALNDDEKQKLVEENAKLLTAEQKQSYIDAAKPDQEVYNQQMKIWKGLFILVFWRLYSSILALLPDQRHEITDPALDGKKLRSHFTATEKSIACLFCPAEQRRDAMKRQHYPSIHFPWQSKEKFDLTWSEIQW
jgi:hypothetical protein